MYLASDWWQKVSALILNKEGIAAVCGLRFLPKNNFCYSIEAYDLTRKDVDFYGGYGKTLDNTIWSTKALKAVGGFSQKPTSQELILLFLVCLSQRGMDGK